MSNPAEPMTPRMRLRRWFGASALLAMVPLLALHLESRGSPARTGARTVWDSVYTLSQASVGEAAYAKTCARCHGVSLSGADEAAPLTGSAFLGNWNGLPLS